MSWGEGGSVTNGGRGPLDSRRPELIRHRTRLCLSFTVQLRSDRDGSRQQDGSSSSTGVKVDS